MKKLRFFAAAFLILGAAFVLIPLHVEFTGYVLLLLGAGTGLVSFLRERGSAPRFCRALTALMCVCLIVLTALMSFVASGGAGASDNPRGVAVVLGAQISSNRPSRILRERLDAGAEYLAEDEGSALILSGGQGTDEHKTEAAVMADYLASLGADMSRVYTEERSSTTRENLIFSRELARAQGLGGIAAVITSDFHVLRAEYIARSLGMDVCGVAAPTGDDFLRLNYYLREVFSFVKAFVQAGGD